MEAYKRVPAIGFHNQENDCGNEREVRQRARGRIRETWLGIRRWRRWGRLHWFKWSGVGHGISFAVKRLCVVGSFHTPAALGRRRAAAGNVQKARTRDEIRKATTCVIVKQNLRRMALKLVQFSPVSSPAGPLAMRIPCPGEK